MHLSWKIGNTPVPLTIQDWSGYIGQWDNGQWKTIPVPPPATPAAGDNSKEAQRARRTLAFTKTHGPIMKPSYVGLTPGFMKMAPVAWYALHLHSTDGSNAIYNYSYLYAYGGRLSTQGIALLNMVALAISSHFTCNRN